MITTRWLSLEEISMLWGSLAQVKSKPRSSDIRLSCVHGKQFSHLTVALDRMLVLLQLADISMWLVGGIRKVDMLRKLRDLTLWKTHGRKLLTWRKKEAMLLEWPWKRESLLLVEGTEREIHCYKLVRCTIFQQMNGNLLGAWMLLVYMVAWFVSIKNCMSWVERMNMIKLN